MCIEIKQKNLKEYYDIVIPNHLFSTAYDSFFEIPAKEVDDLMSEECLFRITATTTVDATNQLVVASHLLNVDKPDLSVKVLSPVIKVGEPMKLELALSNPFGNKALTECEVKIDGSIIDDRICEEVRYENL